MGEKDMLPDRHVKRLPMLLAISQASFTDDVSVQCLSVYRAVPRGK